MFYLWQEKRNIFKHKKGHVEKYIKIKMIDLKSNLGEKKTNLTKNVFC